MSSRSTEEVDAAVKRVDPASQSKWWIFHFIISISLPGFFIGILLAGYVNFPSNVVDVIIFLWLAISLISVFGSLFGYHAEANKMEEIDSDWVPGKWFYTIGHIILTPWIVAPIYLIDRWLAIGLDWSHLKIWKR